MSLSKTPREERTAWELPLSQVAARMGVVKAKQAGKVDVMSLHETDVALPEYDMHIFSALIRYIDEYHWSWSMARRLIRLNYDKEYTVKELKWIYKAGVFLDDIAEEPEAAKPVDQTEETV